MERFVFALVYHYRLMWAAQSIVQELKAAEVLVKARGQEAALLQPLAKSLVHKIQGLRTNNAQELVVLYEAVQGSTLPEDCKSTLNNALDTVATAGVEMAAKTTMQPQAIDHVCNFLSKKDWEAISTQSMWAGASTIAMRLKKLNVQSLKESSKKVITALLVQMEMDRTNKMPSYPCIYQLSQHVLQAFASCDVKPTPGVPSLLKYPATPAELGEEVAKIVYKDDLPETKDVPGLALLIAHHVPVRSTSALLKTKPDCVPAASSTPSASSPPVSSGHMVPSGPTAGAMQFVEWMMRSVSLFQNPGQQGTQELSNFQLCTSQNKPQEQKVDSTVPVLPLPAPAPPEESAAKPVEAPKASAALPVEAPKEQTKPVDQGSERSQSLDDWNNAAFEALKAKKKTEAEKKAPKKSKKQPKAKAQPKGKAAKKQSQKSTGNTKLKKLTTFGCIRCRGNPNGCSTCHNGSFTGKRFSSREEWAKWAKLNGKK